MKIIRKYQAVTIIVKSTLNASDVLNYPAHRVVSL